MALLFVLAVLGTAAARAEAGPRFGVDASGHFQFASPRSPYKVVANDDDIVATLLAWRLQLNITNATARATVALPLHADGRPGLWAEGGHLVLNTGAGSLMVDQHNITAYVNDVLVALGTVAAADLSPSVWAEPVPYTAPTLAVDDNGDFQIKTPGCFVLNSVCWMSLQALVQRKLATTPATTTSSTSTATASKASTTTTTTTTVTKSTSTTPGMTTGAGAGTTTTTTTPFVCRPGLVAMFIVENAPVVNGYYRETSAVYNGRPVYRLMNETTCGDVFFDGFPIRVLFVSPGTWMFSMSSEVYAPVGSLVLVDGFTVSKPAYQAAFNDTLPPDRGWAYTGLAFGSLLFTGSPTLAFLA